MGERGSEEGMIEGEKLLRKWWEPGSKEKKLHTQKILHNRSRQRLSKIRLAYKVFNVALFSEFCLVLTLSSPTIFRIHLVLYFGKY